MSRKAIRIAGALGAATLTTLSLTACGSESAGETITFAAVPSESSTSLESSFENITKLIEQETGATVEFQNASDYAAVIEGMRAGQIDVASFGPFSYVIAKDSGVNMEAAASPTHDPNEAPAYTSLAYVKSDNNDVTGLEDLEGKKVCFVDQASTSGYLVPMKGIMDAGLDMKADMEQVLTGGHDASLLSLDSGNCDVAFAHDTMLMTLEKSGQLEPGALVAVWESDPITEDPLSVNFESLGEETANQVMEILRTKANKSALVEAGICESEDTCELPEEIEYGYVEVSDADFDPIREICEVTNAEACENVG